MKTLLAFGLFILPCSAVADDCRVVEFPDHYEAVCSGDAKTVSISKQAPASASLQAPAQSQTPEQQNSPRQADSSAASEPADVPQTAAPAVTSAKRQGRQGRPNSADMNAAIEARRNLIRQLKTER